eukprot:198023-Chlamydomonas_euryale.AAC.1
MSQPHPASHKVAAECFKRASIHGRINECCMYKCSVHPEENPAHRSPAVTVTSAFRTQQLPIYCCRIPTP